jgi:SAM-dependent methyltransferase
MSQNLLGGRRGRAIYIADYVRPFEGARILDIGCGPGSLVPFLPERIEYVGYDLNPEYIETARRLYSGRGEFFCADAGESSKVNLHQSTFDIVMANSLLHHLDDHQVHDLLESAWRFLKPGGVLMTIDPVFVPGQNPIARYLISNDRGRSVRTPEGYSALVARRFPKIESAVRYDLLRVPYTNFIMRATKA